MSSQYYQENLNLERDSNIAGYRLRKRPLEVELLHQAREQLKNACDICCEQYHPATGVVRMPNFCNRHQPYLDENDCWVFQESRTICRKCFLKDFLNQVNLLGIDRDYDGTRQKTYQYWCPECYNSVPFEQIRPYLPNWINRKLDRAILKQTLMDTGNFYNCPGPDCSFGIVFQKDCQENDDDENPDNMNDNNDGFSAVCPEHGAYCLSCRRWAHPGKTCQENHLEVLANDSNENSFYQWTKKQIEQHQQNAAENGMNKVYFLIKECPNCGAVISRDGGCPSMDCRSCNQNFDWHGVDENSNFQNPLV